MRSLLFASLTCACLLAAAPGCTGKRQEDPRVAQLEAQLAALEADLARKQAAPPAPTLTIDPAIRAALAKYGITVTEGTDVVTLTLPNKALFASGSAKLLPPARRALDHAAKAITTDFPRAEVIVQGHTDNRPIRKTSHLWKSNQQLSEARAEAVAAHLRQAGVDPANISTQGFGESKPVAGNKTKKGRALNRRVEIVIRVRPLIYAAPGAPAGH